MSEDWQLESYREIPQGELYSQEWWFAQCAYRCYNHTGAFYTPAALHEFPHLHVCQTSSSDQKPEGTMTSLLGALPDRPELLLANLGAWLWDSDILNCFLTSRKKYHVGAQQAQRGSCRCQQLPRRRGVYFSQGYRTMTSDVRMDARWHEDQNFVYNLQGDPLA